MKRTFNFTTDTEDIGRFKDSLELTVFMDGFDGVELLCFEPDHIGLIPKDRVVGLHMCYFPYWLDFYNNDRAALFYEFGPEEEWCNYYGGDTPDALFRRFRKDLEYAKYYGAEYVVFHVCDASIEEAFTREYRHTDAEVIDATIEILNKLFKNEDGGIALLLENFWLKGLTFTDPEMSKRLLAGIEYPHKGFMLDTGHLLHTNTKIATQEEGLRYIHEMLDLHEDLLGAVRGVHLNQSLTGEYAERMMARAPARDAPYAEKAMEVFRHMMALDRHEPFTCVGVRELIERVAPEYLTYEFISRSKEEHRAMLDAQHAALSSFK